MVLGTYALIALLLTLLYVGVLWQYAKAWNQLPNWKLPVDFTPTTAVSIIIPARNEELAIGRCLQSIFSQNYPAELLEVFVIDDFSTDKTAEIAFSFKGVRVIAMADILKGITPPQYAFKKLAIEKGIALASGELIITTDADCEAPMNWLYLFSSFYEHTSYEFIAAPVAFHKDNTLIERFQTLDFSGMMLMTGGGIQLGWTHMCNGANLAYTKRLFYEVGGFERINQIASGDDMLLMQKVVQYRKEKIGFLKHEGATMLTTAKPDIPSFIQQRIRWGTKTSAYEDWKMVFVLGVVFLICLQIVGGLLLGLFWPELWLIFAFQLFVKTTADYYFLNLSTQFFNRQDLMSSFFPAQVLHICYILSIGVLSSLRKEYTWKGRVVQ